MPEGSAECGIAALGKGVSCMRFEETREIPVSIKKLWDFATDPMTWPRWFSGINEILDSDETTWQDVGDAVQVAYSVLGRRLEFPCIIQEYEDQRLIRLLCQMPAPLPNVMLTWQWTDLGDEELALTGVVETEPATSWFGKAIDATVLPRMYRRDLATSMDNLVEIAMVEFGV